jgi:glucose-6-phosphate isomerase
VTDSTAWHALASHAERMRGVHLRELVQDDPGRGERFTVEAAGVFFSYARQRVTDETLELLIGLAEERGVERAIEATLDGAVVNVTEGRPALHTALRMSRGAELLVGGVDVVPAVHGVLDRMEQLANALRSGERVGHSGKPLRTVLQLGIGGSHLGPALAVEALAPFADGLVSARFVSSVDPAELAVVLRTLEPEETLVIVASKGFGTAETAHNATVAREWITRALGAEAVAAHVAAATADVDAALVFGIDRDLIFELWDWVGGRTSLCSSVGLPVMLSIGPARFRELLSGFRAMDEHLRETPSARSLPVLHGLLAVWNRDFLGAESAAVVPYAAGLARLPAHLQQLVMESGGKRVTAAGEEVASPTAGVLWGGTGTDAQHSTFQLLHQGTSLVPVDFIGIARSVTPGAGDHDLLVANMLAQAEALALGRTEDELRAAGVPEALVSHRAASGNRPSSVLLLDELTPAALGALLALYEHSVLVQGAIWGIDPFDQWGVELGKELTPRVLAAIEGPDGVETGYDAVTRSLVERYRRARGA